MKNLIYYLLKPALPWGIRITMRRMLANRLKRQYVDSWPVYEPASRAPEGWPGWPNGKKFAFLLTHDVEGMKGFERCLNLAEIDKALGFRSSFNFVPEGEYRLSDSLRTYLIQEGFEVGVHDLHHDGSLYRSARTFTGQAQKINQHLRSWGAVGFRSGFMFHNLQWLQELNVLYDSSTFDTDPFEPQPDGVHTIFPFWVPGNGSRGYVELPYTLAQDSTLFLVFQETSIDLWTRKLDWVAAHGGMALVNVHPDYISFEGKPSSAEYAVEIYERFLKYVSSRYGDDCWFALPREVGTFAAQFKPRLPGGALASLTKPHKLSRSLDLRSKRAGVLHPGFRIGIFSLISRMGIRVFLQKFAEQLWGEKVFLGLRCDLAALPPIHPAKFNITMKRCDSASFPGFIDEFERVGGLECIELVLRQSMCSAGVPTLYAATGPDGAPAYTQWLVTMGDEYLLHSLQPKRYPRLASDEVLLEGSYTFSRARRTGVMSDGMAQLLRIARTNSARSAITYVASDNIPALRGCANVGFTLDHVRMNIRRFGFLRSVVRPIDEFARQVWTAAIAPHQ
jgi:hypothetical protein